MPTMQKKNSLPAGWKRSSQKPFMCPTGYYYATNGKSRFDPGFKSAWVRDPVECARLKKAEIQFKKNEKKAIREGSKGRAKIRSANSGRK